MWLTIKGWLLWHIHRISDPDWVERPSAFTKALKAALANETITSMRDVQIRSDSHQGFVKLSGEGVMNLSIDGLTFDDVVYIEGKLSRKFLVLILRCEMIYDGVIPSLTVKLHLNDDVFKKVSGVAAKFKRDLDRRHSKHSDQVV